MFSLPLPAPLPWPAPWTQPQQLLPAARTAWPALSPPPVHSGGAVAPGDPWQSAPVGRLHALLRPPRTWWCQNKRGLIMRLHVQQQTKLATLHRPNSARTWGDWSCWLQVQQQTKLAILHRPDSTRTWGDWSCVFMFNNKWNKNNWPPPDGVRTWQDWSG